MLNGYVGKDVIDNLVTKTIAAVGTKTPDAETTQLGAQLKENYAEGMAAKVEEVAKNGLEDMRRQNSPFKFFVQDELYRQSSAGGGHRGQTININVSGGAVSGNVQYVGEAGLESLLATRAREIEDAVNAAVRETFGKKAPADMRFALDTEAMINTAKLDPASANQPRILIKALDAEVSRQIKKYADTRVKVYALENLPAGYVEISNAAASLDSRADKIEKELKTLLGEKVKTMRPGEKIDPAAIEQMRLKAVWNVLTETEKKPYYGGAAGGDAFANFEKAVKEIGVELGEEVELKRGTRIPFTGKRLKLVPEFMEGFLARPGVRKWTGRAKGYAWGAIWCAMVLYGGNLLKNEVVEPGWDWIVRKNDVSKTIDLHGTPQPGGTTTAATSWMEDQITALDLTNKSKYRVLVQAPQANYKIKNLYLDIQPGVRGGPEVGLWNGKVQFGVHGPNKTDMAVVPGKYYLMELELDPVGKSWTGTFSEVNADQSKDVIAKMGGITYLKLGAGEKVAVTSNSKTSGSMPWAAPSGTTVIIGRDEAP
jgi:hypothetical protein